MFPILETALIFSEEENHELTNRVVDISLEKVFNESKSDLLILKNENSLQILLILAEIFVRTKDYKKLAKCLETYAQNSKQLKSSKFAPYFILINTDLSIDNSEGTEAISLLQKFLENNDTGPLLNDVLYKVYLKSLLSFERFYELSLHEKLIENKCLNLDFENEIDSEEKNRILKHFKGYQGAVKVKEGKVLVDVEDLEVENRFNVNSPRIDPTFGRETQIRRVFRLSYFY